MSILECSSGYYGKNCENRCSENCYMTGRCDRVTGQCNRGCKPGWTTKTCKQSRYFGKLLIVKTTIVTHFEHTCFKESTHTHHLYVNINMYTYFLISNKHVLLTFYKISCSVGLIEAKLWQAALLN